MRLIDADRLQAKVDEALCDEEAYGYIDEFEISKLIKNAPIVDAVPVVRCKDCKYHNKTAYNVCNRLPIASSALDNDFCSYGERREDK